MTFAIIKCVATAHDSQLAPTMCPTRLSTPHALLPPPAFHNFASSVYKHCFRRNPSLRKQTC
ncbi:hypothetical protein VFPPC_15284 [Pochonia chlamydosporia 170]|uniref:Uncharacterized protein n=1 Tax=Pochonia chlamydosporia 170 TaxID=1380566 RepID=A0A179G719_METCM|nr:hypothetical protein VFPPC_15284 [Pochonia chlamydosporia 170]OAQ73300.1 hypothetical protein VFPPC_15284 [Pochonia chlamydosporia 170]